MAIDTPSKRRSAAGSLPAMPGVTPNMAKDNTWRKQAAWLYSGIPAVVWAYGNIVRLGDVTVSHARITVATLVGPRLTGIAVGGAES